MLPNTNPDVPLNLHTLTQSVTLEVLSSTVCLLGGYDPMSASHQCLGFDPQTKRIGYMQSDGGLLGFSTKMVAMVAMPPQVHTIDYISYLGNNFGITGHAYAQNKQQQIINQAGTGFAGITPLLPIWVVFRNLVYILFVIVFIFVGFAIMLRYKIDPRTVMTIENQLPKLIVGLILVTFSFAIAGIAIDVMWVVTFLVISILSNIHSGVATTNVPQNVVTGNIFQNPIGFFNAVAPGGFFGTAFGAGGSIGDVVKGLFTPYGGAKLGLTPPATDCAWYNPACWLNNSVGSAIENAVGYLLSFIISILGIIIVLIALLITMFRLWFTLLLSYGFILVDILIGPFFIVSGLFPGSKVGVGLWVRDLLSNLIAFPTTIAMFLLANLLMNSFVSNAEGGTNTLFVPPLIGNPNGTADPNLPGNPLGWLVGLALILMTPQIVAIMKSLFKAPDFKYTQAIFQGLAGGGSVLGGAAKETVAGVIAKRLGALPQKGEGGFLTALRRWVR